MTLPARHPRRRIRILRRNNNNGIPPPKEEVTKQERRHKAKLRKMKGDRLPPSLIIHSGASTTAAAIPLLVASDPRRKDPGASSFPLLEVQVLLEGAEIVPLVAAYFPHDLHIRAAPAVSGISYPL